MPCVLGVVLLLLAAADPEPAVGALEQQLSGEAAAVPLRRMHEKGLLSDEEYLSSLREVDAKRVKPPFNLTGGPGKGVTLTAADDRFSLTLRSRFSIRGTTAFTTRRTALEHVPDLARQTALATTSDVNIKTLRLYFTGHTVTPELKYTIQLAFGAQDFEAGNSSPIFDAWVEWTKFRDFNLRVGQFFVPFDRARTVREFSLQFVDRQQVIQELTMDRDVGVELSSKDLLGWGGRLSYNLFLGGGEGRNRTVSAVPGLLWSARVALKPMGQFDDDSEGDLERSFKPRLALGAAVAFNHNAVRARGTTGNTFQLGSFNYIYADVDMVAKYGGFSFLAEALLRTNASTPQGWKQMHQGLVGTTSTKEWSRSGAGVVLQGGMMVTDKLEFTGRFDRLWALPDTDPALKKQAEEQGTELGTGANLYLNGHRFKVQADYQVQLAYNLLNPAKHVVRVALDGSF